MTVFAGPNGSGKSSITRRLQFEGKHNLLDPDAIAKRMDSSDPGRAAVAAGREVIRRTRHYLKSRESFAIETTLAGRRTLVTIRLGIERGFVIRLVYVCVDNPERSIQRVNQGGHDVPDDEVRRRDIRSLLNLPVALRAVNEAVVWDNSGAEPQKMLEVRDGTITWVTSGEAPWVTRVVERMK